MIRAALTFACVALAACRDPQPFQPFERTSWLSAPSDDDVLVAGIVGHGGTRDERDELTEAVRDVLVPQLHRQMNRSGKSLEHELDELRHLWEIGNEPGAGAFLRFVLEERVTVMAAEATVAAQVRVHALLWPTEPLPDDWDSDGTRALKNPEAVAASLEAELDRLAARWKLAVTESLPFHTARNMAHVARTGDYGVTCGVVYDVLIKRHIQTGRDPKTVAW